MIQQKFLKFDYTGDDWSLTAFTDSNSFKTPLQSEYYYNTGNNLYSQISATEDTTLNYTVTVMGKRACIFRN